MTNKKLLYKKIYKWLTSVSLNAQVRSLSVWVCVCVRCQHRKIKYVWFSGPESRFNLLIKHKINERGKKSAVSWVCSMSLNTTVPRSFSGHCPSRAVKSHVSQSEISAVAVRSNKPRPLSALSLAVSYSNALWDCYGHSLLPFHVQQLWSTRHEM